MCNRVNTLCRTIIPTLLLFEFYRVALVRLAMSAALVNDAEKVSVKLRVCKALPMTVRFTPLSSFAIAPYYSIPKM